jgi:enterochelin esterase-like enzyme
MGGADLTQLARRLAVRSRQRRGDRRRAAEPEWLARQLATVLRARGSAVEYREFNGGHSILSWRGSFADGVLVLFGN